MENTKTLTVRMTDGNLAALAQRAEEHGVGVSTEARRIIEGFLDGERVYTENSGVIDGVVSEFKRVDAKATKASLAMLAKSCMDNYLELFRDSDGTIPPDVFFPEWLRVTGFEPDDMWDFYWQMGETMLRMEGRPDWRKALKAALAWSRKNQRDQWFDIEDWEEEVIKGVNEL